MRQVIQYQKTGEMLIEELPTPKLKSGGILVQNVCSLISAGTERTSVQTAQASMVGKARSRPDLVKQVMDSVKQQGVVATYKKVQNRLDNYKQLGYSSAGIVIESAVDEFKPGDRVACAGGGYASHAETVFIPKNLAAKMPDDVSFEEAACTTLCAIAMQGVRQADLRLGECVAVIGLGLVGLITVQLLKATGCRVIGLDVSPGNFELAQQLGCDDCIISGFDAIDPVMNFSKGHGTDAVIITAATNSNEPVELALAVARKKSKVVIVGAVKMDIPRAPFYEKEIDLRNSCSYGPGRYDPNYEERGQDYPIGYVRWTEKRNMDACLDLMAQGKLDVKSLITHQFPIEDALKAYDVIMGKTKEKYLGILIQYPERERDGRLPVRKLELNGKLQADAKKQAVVGFIGAGNFAQSFLIPPLQKQGIELRAVATATPVNAKSVGQKFKFGYCATDPEELLNDEQINTIFVATRHDSHAHYVLEGLRQGKRVYVEKPLALTHEQADAISNLYQKGETPFLMVGYNRRFSQPVRAIKAFFAGRNEALVMHFRVNAGFIPKDNWYQAEEQGGRLIGEGGHFIDTLQFLTDAFPVQVFAVAAADPGNRYNQDNVNVTITFSDGSIGTISYVANGATSLEKEYLEVFGESKSAVMNNFKRVDFYKGRKSWKKKFSGEKGHAAEIQAVANALKVGQPAPIAADSLLATSYATFAAVESLMQKKVVMLDYMTARDV